MLFVGQLLKQLDDVISAIHKLIEYDGEDLTEMNVGSGHAASLNELLSCIKSILGKELKIKYTPKRDFDVPVSLLDISRAKQLLNWEPKYSLMDGLAKTIEWIRENDL